MLYRIIPFSLFAYLLVGTISLPRAIAAEPGRSEVEISPEVVENSPTLQRWQQQIPDLQQEINNDPSFRTRLRLGYNQFPSSNNTSGLGVGVTDLFIGESAFTVDGDYETNFRSRYSGGVNLNYYLLPLGSYINLAPLVGYRSIGTGDYNTNGINVGGKIMFSLSRTGGGDLAFSQNFISPGSDQEVGITTLSVGYAISENWRISTDLQQQNSRANKDNRVGIYLEWMPSIK